MPGTGFEMCDIVMRVIAALGKSTFTYTLCATGVCRRQVQKYTKYPKKYQNNGTSLLYLQLPHGKCIQINTTIGFEMCDIVMRVIAALGKSTLILTTHAPIGFTITLKRVSLFQKYCQISKHISRIFVIQY